MYQPVYGVQGSSVLACAFNCMDADALLRCLKHTFITVRPYRR